MATATVVMPSGKISSIPVTGPLNQWNVPPCPECGRNDFKARTALGGHRKTAHGVAGGSKTAIEMRAAKEHQDAKAGPDAKAVDAKATKAAASKAAPTTSTPSTPLPVLPSAQPKKKLGRPPKVKAEAPTQLTLDNINPLECPECRAAGKTYVAPNPASLGRHRRFGHNVMGKFAARNAEYRERKEAGDTHPQSPSTIDLIPRRNVHHGSYINGHAQTGDSSPSQETITVELAQLQIKLAIGISRVKELLRFIADEEGVPTAEYSRQCIELLYRSTVRK